MPPKAKGTKKTKQETLGQYFTKSEVLQNFIFEKVQHKQSLLLEPAFGAGHLLTKFLDSNKDYPILCYEIDSTLKPCVRFTKHQTPIYADFFKQTLTQKFKTIIGNPPFVKQKGQCNLYLQFIETCFEALDDDGELLFIVPSDFMKATNASNLIHLMTRVGRFTDFLFPHDEKLFENAAIDIVVFRYQKGVTMDTTRVNGKEMICTCRNGILSFTDTNPRGTAVDELFHVYVGLVSGRDEIYRQPFGNLTVRLDKDTTEKFIFADTFPTTDSDINAHLLKHKQALLDRKIKKFSETNWYEWGAPRNMKSMKQYWGRPCIYVRNLTRNKEVAFKGTVEWFGGALLCLVPKKEMDTSTLERILSYLNSELFQKQYLYAGRFKIGHKQISNALLPME
jgi:adenine-specific DNA-methyltransferase